MRRGAFWGRPVRGGGRGRIRFRGGGRGGRAGGRVVWMAATALRKGGESGGALMAGFSRREESGGFLCRGWRRGGRGQSGGWRAVAEVGAEGDVGGDWGLVGTCWSGRAG